MWLALSAPILLSLRLLPALAGERQAEVLVIGRREELALAA
jgi:hypothetical protein